MPFRTTLNVDEAGPGTWKLGRDLVYEWRPKGFAPTTFIVPVGFETDYASSPRFLWWLVPPFGPYTKAAVLHDWLYRTGLTSRRDADRVFLAVMLELRTRRLRALAMWAAVRAFGWLHYKATGGGSGV